VVSCNPEVATSQALTVLAALNQATRTFPIRHRHKIHSERRLDDSGYSKKGSRVFAILVVNARRVTKLLKLARESLANTTSAPLEGMDRFFSLWHDFCKLLFDAHD